MPDRGWLATGCDDGTLRIWEAASPEQAHRWARQDHEVERRWSVWQRPGPKAPGFIQSWLVLAPLALKEDRRGAKGLEHQLPGEASLLPRAGEHVHVDGQEITWQAHHEEGPILDFSRLVGKGRSDCVLYAVCYVSSAADRHDLLLQLGSNNLAKAYVNGREVYKYNRGDTLGALEPIGPVTLRQGRNVLMLKVVEDWCNWLGCARFVDLESNPVQGLQVRLTPD
jgi:hypothetical protein